MPTIVFFALILLAGIGRGLFGTADDAALRSIVPRETLARAQATIQSREALVDLVGPPLGGDPEHRHPLRTRTPVLSA